MSGTRKKIVDGARNLFNSEGIANVTMRMIALDLGMSPGNLTYHFKKRHEILEAIYYEMVEEFEAPLKNLDNLVFSVENLFHSSRVNYVRMLEYRFIWADLRQLMRESDQIREHFIAARRRREMGYRFMVSKFVESDLFLEEGFIGEFDLLSRRMVDLIDFWIPSAALEGSDLDKKVALQFHQKFMSMLFPYFSKRENQHTKN